MADSAWSHPTRQHLPLILIRGYAGLDTTNARQSPYQSFERGTVYPEQRGESYIYEGLLLRFVRSHWQYYDAINVIGYYPDEMPAISPIPEVLRGLPEDFFYGKIVVDPDMAARFLTCPDPKRSIWVFRYYDLLDRQFTTYGDALYDVIAIIRALVALRTGEPPKVNIVAHSMGGLIVREAVQRAFPARSHPADEAINKIVTLGTPHKGTSIQRVRDFGWLSFSGVDESEHLNHDNQIDPINPTAAIHFHRHFPLERLYTVVGTNYKAFSSRGPVRQNHWYSVTGEFGLNYNRSDGLVKQAYAQIEGTPLTYLHVPHDGHDSLITGRASYEVTTRFLFGNVQVRLRLVRAQITEGFDLIGNSEFFHGVTVKPRGVNFELFHQSAAAENCVGPLHRADLNDDPDAIAFPWLGDNRLIWEGYLSTDFAHRVGDLVMRLEIYVGERDLRGLGFSDTIVFQQQYFVRAVLEPQIQLFLCPRLTDNGGQPMRPVGSGWEFDVQGPGYTATYGLEFDTIPEDGGPQPFVQSP